MSKKNILISIYCLAAFFSFFAGVVLAGDNRLPVLLTSTAGFLLFAAAGFKFRREFIKERIGREEQLYSVVSNSGAVFFMADTHGGLIYVDNGCRSLEKKYLRIVRRASFLLFFLISMKNRNLFHCGNNSAVRGSMQV